MSPSCQIPRLAIGLLVVLFSLSANHSDALTVSEIAKANLSSVATLIAVDENQQPLSLGSGFFIDGAGTLVTNGHVIEGASQVIVRWRGQNGRATQLRRFDPRLDLVVLGTSFQKTSSVQMGDSEVVTVGEEVVVLSNPQGLEGSVTSGILSGVRISEGIKYQQITAPISPGSSGGPVFNMHGRVIGVATATISTGQNLNFALPINLLHDLPTSSQTFREIRIQETTGEGSKEGRTLVVPTNVIKNFGEGALQSITFSLQNNSNDWIGKVKVFAVFYNYLREPLSYSHYEYKDVVIPPKLAKQVGLYAGVKGLNFFTKDKVHEGSIEIRILDYKIIRRGGDAVDILFKNN